VTEDGEVMRPWRISWLYERRVREAKLRRVQFKNLRHSHACLLLDAGVDLYTVSRRLGHSSVAVTESHYVRPSERADRAAAEALRIVGQNWPRANFGQGSSRQDPTAIDGE
jgi:integrase